MKQEYFANHFNAITKTVEFKPEWNNGTGYMDGIVYDRFLENGEVAKTTTENNRRVIIVGTRFGNCVFFERYTPTPETENVVIVSNVPRRLTNIITSGRLGYDEFCRLASPHLNIGKAVEVLFSDNTHYKELEEMYKEGTAA